MTNQNKMTIRVISYGAIVKDILVPDRDGNIADVNLGFDNIEGNYITYQKFEKLEVYFILWIRNTNARYFLEIYVFIFCKYE